MNKYLQDFTAVESKQELSFEDGVEYVYDTMSMESSISDCITYTSALAVLADNQDIVTIEALSIALGAPINVVEELTSTEGVKDIADKTWAAIKKTIKTILEWFKKHWDRMFGKNTEEDMKARENAVKSLPATVLDMDKESNKTIIDASPTDKKERNKAILRRGLIAFSAISMTFDQFRKMTGKKSLTIDIKVDGDLVVLKYSVYDPDEQYHFEIPTTVTTNYVDAKMKKKNVVTMLNTLPLTMKDIKAKIEECKTNLEKAQRSSDNRQLAKNMIVVYKNSLRTLNTVYKYFGDLEAAMVLRKEFEELLTK